MEIVLIWCMGGIAVCLLWMAAAKANKRERMADHIISQEVDIPRQRRADKRAATVAAMERQGG